MNARALAGLLINPAGLLLVKVTAVLATACVAAGLVTNLSAARRHLLFVVALVSCAWLVVSSPIVPAIAIEFPMVVQEVATKAASGASAATRATSTEAPTIATQRVQPQLVNTRGPASATRRRMPSPSHALVLLWIVGCAAMLCRHATALASMARLARRASIVSNGEPIRELAHAAAAVGVHRAVRLGYSPEVQSPITFGVATPVVLLPVEARSWSSECRRAVLLHETAHIARGDWLSQTVGRLARDLFWFHPLAWRVFAHLRDAAERAADDCVLGSGMCAMDYASHILQVARAMNALPSLAAVGVISSNDVERRFVAMFDTKRSRTIVTSNTRLISASVALAVVSPFAALRVAAHATSESSQRPSPPSSAPATESASSERRSSVARPAPHARHANTSAHPDLSGIWRPDTNTDPGLESLVMDSTIIRASAHAISIESRGRFHHEPTHNRFVAIPFGGAGVQGFTVTGIDTASVIASALWYGDTLVIDTHVNGATAGGSYIHTIERLSLSPDGNTLVADNLSYVGGRYRWGGPRTVVLRRAAPCVVGVVANEGSMSCGRERRE